MKKSFLVETAEQLIQPSQKSAMEYEQKSEQIAAEMNSIMSERKDLEKLIGNNNQAMMEDNHRNHARFLSSVFNSYNPQVLVETVLWVFRAYRSHGFQLTYWPAQLDLWVKLLKKNLSPEAFVEIYPFYNWMLINQAGFVLESEKLSDTDKIPLHE